MRKKIEVEYLSKEERDRQIESVRISLQETEDKLIMAEISGAYSLLEEVRELLLKRIKLLEEVLIKQNEKEN